MMHEQSLATAISVCLVSIIASLFGVRLVSLEIWQRRLGSVVSEYRVELIEGFFR